MAKQLSIRVGSEQKEVFPMVVRIASRVARWASPEAEFEDLVAEGLRAVADASRRYREDSPASISSFLHYRIRGAILDYAISEKKRASMTDHVDFTPNLDGELEGVPEPASLEPGPDCLHHRQLFLVAVRVMEQKMDPRLSTILVRTYLEGLSDGEIAVLECLPKHKVASFREEGLEVLRAYFRTCPGPVTGKWLTDD